VFTELLGVFVIDEKGEKKKKQCLVDSCVRVIIGGVCGFGVAESSGWPFFRLPLITTLVCKVDDELPGVDLFSKEA
jgi:hypothetical protein